MLDDTAIRKLATGSILSFAIKIGSAGLSFLMFVALARAMDAKSYGIVGIVFSLATFCAVVGSIGQRSNVMRYAATFDEKNNHDLRRGVVVFGYVISSCGALIAGMFGAVFLYFSIDISTTVSLLIGMVALTVAFGLVEYQSRAMRVSAAIPLILLPRDVFWRGFIFVMAALMAVSAPPMTDAHSAWIWLLAVSLFLVVGIQFWLYQARYPAKSIIGKYEIRPREWLQASLGPWASLVAVSAAANLAVVFVGAFMDVHNVGPFFAALRTSQLLGLFTLATEIVLTPMLARFIANNNYKKVQNVSTLSSLLGGGFSIVGLIIFWLFGSFLLRFFGADFDSAYPALIIMSVGYAINSLAGPTSPLMMMGGRALHLSQMQILSNLLALGALPFAIEAYGINGAAVCILFAQVFWNIIAWIYCRRVFGVDPTVFAPIFQTRRTKDQ